jgi:hypothetical protein
MGRRGVNSWFKWLLTVFATHRGRGEGIRAVCPACMHVYRLLAASWRGEDLRVGLNCVCVRLCLRLTIILWIYATWTIQILQKKTSSECLFYISPYSNPFLNSKVLSPCWFQGACYCDSVFNNTWFMPALQIHIRCGSGSKNFGADPDPVKKSGLNMDPRWRYEQVCNL